jgi:FkbM family methyltransferase
LTQQQPQQQKQRTAVYVGCNKGMDAINTLRMLSNNPSVDKFVWRDAFFENQTVAAGHCKQEFEPQYTIQDNHNSNSNSNPTVVNAVVHCLEAMPVTAQHLAQTARRLNLQDRLLVKNTAASDINGWTFFPNQPDGKVGVEGLGLDACSNPKIVTQNPHLCANVSIETLDSLLLSDHVDDNANSKKVDLLSIDVEGYDFNVLLGAKRILPHVRYLEFEYNWKGPWGKQPLSTAMEYLESLGFVCYWAGNKGRVWRITNCWRESYNLHFWSNVACVNGKDPVVRSMAEQLEEMFQSTLRQGAKLAWEIDQEFRAFYKDVKAGYVKTAEGLSFAEA